MLIPFVCLVDWVLGLSQLYQHTYEHNRMAKALSKANTSITDKRFCKMLILRTDTGSVCEVWVNMNVCDDFVK